jgi:hypothetical protein
MPLPRRQVISSSCTIQLLLDMHTDANAICSDF